MIGKTNVDRHKEPMMKADDVVRYMKNQARGLGVADALINDIKVENDKDIRLSFNGDTEVLEIIRRLTIKIAACIRAFSKQDLEDIGLAVDEACTNVIQHSYANTPNCAIKLEFVMDTDKLSIRLKDNGPRGKVFDLEYLDPIDVKSYLNTSPKGGFGVHLIRKIMDNVDYSVSQGAYNCLTMVKYANVKGKQ